MNTQFPNPLSAVMPPQHRAADVTSEMGLAVGPCRTVTDRLHSFISQTEPQRLMLKACIYMGFASALTVTGGIGLIASPGPVPLAFVGLAGCVVVRVRWLFDDMAAYERRSQETIDELADMFANQVERLNLLVALTHAFHATGDLEGAPARSGEMPGSRGVRKERLPGIDSNIVYPPFPRRPQ